jgi:chorismate synthase
MIIENEDHNSRDYDHIKDQYRPSHADMVYDAKYGIRDYRGGGRSSARETATRVAAAAVAKLLLQQKGIQIHAGVTQVGSVKMDFDKDGIDWAICESNNVRCPNHEVARKMEEAIVQVQQEGDTLGGVISCEITNCPAGLGEPVFDKLHADLAKAMLSINAVKGFEYGSGFAAAAMRGSDHNDKWQGERDRLTTETNYSGGIQGGISNSMPIYFNVAFKPVATIMKDQKSVDSKGQESLIKAKGRHDPCVVPRAVPIVEAMAALVLADHYLRSLISKI